MRLIRFGEKGRERPGVLIDENTALDVSSIVPDFDPRFFATDGIIGLRRVIEAGPDLPRVDLAATRIGPPVACPGKLIAVGLNFTDHARETNSPIPRIPVLFCKAVSAINGPCDDVVCPTGYSTMDYEVELAFVIGSRCRRARRVDALDHVAGYCICNDVSERTAQKEGGGQWFHAKSFDTFAPLGPWLVTADETGDPHDLALVSRINGEVRQNGSTKTFIFDIPTLIEFISAGITLEPGDIVTTGTPPGVGVGMKPPRFLKPGDVMELEITNLGMQRSRIVAEEASPR